MPRSSLCAGSARPQRRSPLPVELELARVEQGQRRFDLDRGSPRRSSRQPEAGSGGVRRRTAPNLVPVAHPVEDHVDHTSDPDAFADDGAFEKSCMRSAPLCPPAADRERTPLAARPRRPRRARLPRARGLGTSRSSTRCADARLRTRLRPCRRGCSPSRRARGRAPRASARKKTPCASFDDHIRPSDQLSKPSSPTRGTNRHGTERMTAGPSGSGRRPRAPVRAGRQRARRGAAGRSWSYRAWGKVGAAAATAITS